MLMVVVKMKVSSADYARFKPLLVDNAAASLMEEGCFCFDIGELQEASPGSHAFLLYEVYQDREAFERHLTSAHFLSFDRQTAAMLQHKAIAFYQQIGK
ncbi:hypothetical protein BTJ39_00420 [Izhakiella australiensis]|uniref:ABM domain-containing protein n=1 Tax=Izhakiella australiensis TaxID=1926881 RepID=A0A1S8YS61_9GAMM|nr:putative quinol monooxygenase [Izhakiella australiensis]OON41666.1 hypothetical protein BTJ39_00420 [Izhakiella australiensis]